MIESQAIFEIAPGHQMKLHLKILILLVLLGLSRKSYADTFVVTSNADSGPGSLREAITLANANGTTVKDYILFNVPDVTRVGRTIIPLTELPALSSNLVIDGTSQTGAEIGKSNAKIILLINTAQAASFTFFKFENAVDIEIYGLFFFNEVFTLFSSGYPIDGIKFQKSKNITIGKPGKGNYFRGLYNAIASLFYQQADVNVLNCSDVTIKSNVFGNDEDGEPTILYQNAWTSVNPVEYAINFYNARNIIIGGETATEGNTITSRNIYIKSFLQTGGGVITIKNNNLSISTTGIITNNSSAQPLIVAIQGEEYLPIDYDVNIKDNILHGSIQLSWISRYFSIQSNTIFIHNAPLPIGNYRIVLLACSQGGKIGGDTAGEENIMYSTSLHAANYSWQLDQGSVSVFGSPKVSILKNVMYCNEYYNSSIYHPSSPYYTWEIPFVRIESQSPNFVSGKATPNARIDVFLDDECSGCEGKVYLGQTVSSTDSSWSFSGALNGTVVALVTNSEGTTSEFTNPIVDVSTAKITIPTCDQKNGSITGITLSGTWDNVEWHTVFTRDGFYIDSLISRNINATNLAEGDYYFVAKWKETCKSTAMFFRLKNNRPKIDDTNLQFTNPSCGKFNGSIYGLIYSDYEYSRVVLINEQGNITSTERNTTFTGLAEGKYKVILTDTIGGCADSTDWIELKNQSGPLLTTNNIQIIPATCNNANGSIINITSTAITGTPFIQWVDSSDNPVGNALNLSNVPAGKYRLKFKDESGCDTIITPYYTITNIGAIVIDTTGKIITASSCTANTGTIQNIKVTGASDYQWINTVTNSFAGNTLSASNLAPGNYQFTASNATGCSTVSPVINVPPASFSPISVTSSQANNATCAEINGSISLTGFSVNASAYSFKWINKTTNKFISNGTTINNLGAGTYAVLATDMNGCEKEIFSTTLQAFPKPSFDLSGLIITDDKCSLKQGSISGIKLNGVSGSNTTYTWKDANNFTVPGSLSLQHVPAGQYTLAVTDSGTCNIQSTPFTVNNNDNAGIQPQYENQTIPRFTAATLSVRNPQDGNYYLYSDAAGAQLLQQNNSGVFITTQLPANTDFYIKHVTGTCSSPLISVKITVVDKSFFSIPSAFTPNNDGKNDKLNLKIIGYIGVEYFKIYNRNGEEVFTTKTVNDGWNGVYRGNPQPSSVFVWVAKGKDLLGNTIEQKGTFVLIR